LPRVALPEPPDEIENKFHGMRMSCRAAQQ
jgi:hypothetical protein